MKKLLINSILVTSLVVGNGLVVLAQTETGNMLRPIRPAVREATTEKKEAMKEAVIEKKDAMRTAVTERKDAMKDATAEKRKATEAAAMQRKEAMEKARIDFKQKVDAAKEEFQKKREASKTELKARLEKVKDEKKKAAVERLDNRFTEINAKMTNHWLNALTRLEELLNKVSSRADKATEKGTDVSVVRTAVEKAKTEIASARTALEAQLKKTYPIQVTDETKLKSAVSTTREALNKDLKAVKEAVQKAHKAVVEATKSLKGVPKVDEEPVPAPAPTQ